MWHQRVTTQRELHRVIPAHMSYPAISAYNLFREDSRSVLILVKLALRGTFWLRPCAAVITDQRASVSLEHTDERAIPRRDHDKLSWRGLWKHTQCEPAEEKPVRIKPCPPTTNTLVCRCSACPRDAYHKLTFLFDFQSTELQHMVFP
jgi:hypothetical protein